MMTEPVLLMIHGRAQGGKDPETLRQTWIDTWAKGLAPDQAARLGEIDIRFPFYADVLDEMAEQANLSENDIRTRGPVGEIDPQFAAFRAEIFEAAMDKAELRAALAQEVAYRDRGPMQWEWVQTIIKKLEEVPGLSGHMLERFTRDVWIYLKYPPVRKRINAIVQAELPSSGEVFVLGHSLGSVVAYDVVRTATTVSVPLFMTVGSPLGVRKIAELLDPRHFPAVTKSWYNAYDVRDVVALRPLDRANFNVDPEIENFGEVHNHTPNAHGIVGYLNNRTIAEKLFKAVLG